MHHIVLATDGSFDTDTGQGGWAAVCALQTRIWTISGREQRAESAHLMELRAIAEGLRALTKPCKVLILTDDQRVLHNLEHGAEGKAETALWGQVLKAALPHSVKFEWIKGHAGHPLNEQAHALAQLACTLPLDAEGQPSSPRKSKKERKQQELESELNLIDVPFQVVPTGQKAALILNTGQNTWNVQLSGPLGSSTLEGSVEGTTTLQYRLYTAIQAGLLTLPPACDVSLFCKGSTSLEATWRSKSPAKGHRDLVRAVRALVTEREHVLSFKEL